MPATKTKATKTKAPKTLAAIDIGHAHARALMFFDACADAESADVREQVKTIKAQADDLAQKIAAWQAAGAKGPQPRSLDGCSPEQLTERITWQEGQRPREVSETLGAVIADFDAAKRAAPTLESFFDLIQSKRAGMAAATLNKIRSKPGKTAFDAAFKRPN